jgi:zinc/manganese transport system ATP-binding protein
MMALSFSNLSVGHEGRASVIGLTGHLADGETLALTGRNGAGKTTLLRTLAGRLKPLAGQIVRAGSLAFVPQSTTINRAVPVTVHDFAAMGLWQETGAWGRIGGRHRDRIGSALTSVGLDGLSGQMIATLSGGQFQRLLLARVIVQDAPVILLDEPFAAVDVPTRTELAELILTLGQQGRTVIAALHDPDLAARFSRRLELSPAGPVWMGADISATAASGLRVVQGGAA